MEEICERQITSRIIKSWFFENRDKVDKSVDKPTEREGMVKLMQ